MFTRNITKQCHQISERLTEEAEGGQRGQKGAKNQQNRTRQQRKQTAEPQSSSQIARLQKDHER